VNNSSEFNYVYLSVSFPENYLYFNLDSVDNLAAITQIIGETDVIGVRLRQPKVYSEHVVRARDAVNVTIKLELYPNSS
jgi:hypothetical protein